MALRTKIIHTTGTHRQLVNCNLRSVSKYTESDKPSPKLATTIMIGTTLSTFGTCKTAPTHSAIIKTINVIDFTVL
jgi:hypothetical protein